MVIAAVGFCIAALTVDRPAEFAAPDDQRILEQAPLLEILHQRGRTLIDLLGDLRMAAGQAAVVVPTAVVDLNEAHTAFQQAPCQQAVGRVGAGDLGVGTVQFER